ncbi:hypothetical protein NKH77_46405 [Streptomyces sp. M19]
MGCDSDCYSSQTHDLAAAGFICPLLLLRQQQHRKRLQRQLVEGRLRGLTRTLALNDTAGDPFAGHIDTTVGVGVSGHSMGGMTTHGLLTAWPDNRIVAAVPVACVDMGNPAGLAAKVLFIHGSNDPTCDYNSARTAYGELAAPKAFLTQVGADHGSYLTPNFPYYAQTENTFLDWFRWGLYGDTAARGRLQSDATSNGTSWDAALP